MAPSTAAPAKDAVPSAKDIKRASEFACEPLLLNGDGPETLVSGTARRRALDAALVELDAGLKEPSVEWRRNFSLLLGLERLIGEEPPTLKDGAELNPHQIDALSGTLTELLAEQQVAPVVDLEPYDELDGDEPEAESTPEPGPEEPGAGDDDPTDLEDDESEDDGDDEAEDDADHSDEDLPDPHDEDAQPEDEPEEEPLPPVDEAVAEDEEPRDWEDPAEEEADEEVGEAPDDPGAARRFWFEHATGAGKTVAAVGFIEATRTGGVLILTHRRNLVDQFIAEISARGYRDRLRPPLLDGRDEADGPVTVETYQWFVRNAKRVSNAYTVVICDEAHTALGEKTSATIRAWSGPIFVGMTATGALIARHVADLFPTQTSRFDLAQAARRGVISPLRCLRIPPGPGVRTIAKVPLRKGEVDQDFDQEELAKLLDQAPFNMAIADLYKSRFRKAPGVLYTAGVQHAKNVAAAFREFGINAKAVSGETPKRELSET
ncbi:MAG: DEAD/DEAH box helicase family protein, partial [Actinomycetota bacterium]|nr:DEAD/DEAH box helicase family protein [Actinomycetota bacterium]